MAVPHGQHCRIEIILTTELKANQKEDGIAVLFLYSEIGQLTAQISSEHLYQFNRR